MKQQKKERRLGTTAKSARERRLPDKKQVNLLPQQLTPYGRRGAASTTRVSIGHTPQIECHCGWVQMHRRFPCVRTASGKSKEQPCT